MSCPHALQGIFTAPWIVRSQLGALACALCSGCVVAIPQPGQTPAQVQACTVDATWANVTQGSAGVLAGAAATQASIAATQDQGVQKDLAISSAVTAGAAAGLTLVSGLLSRTYQNDGCKPSIGP